LSIGLVSVGPTMTLRQG